MTVLRKVVMIAVAAVLAMAVVVMWEARGSRASSGTSLDHVDVTFRLFQRTTVDPIHGPNVLLISVDTLRADHTSVYGYERNTTPNLKAFADESLVFERAYTTSTVTPPSVISMLTGLYPYNHRVRLFFQRIPDRCITLADHLRRAGYQTAAVVSNLCLTDRASGLGARFDYFDDALDDPPPDHPDLWDRRAADTTDSSIAWLEDHGTSDQPLFLWVHYMDPHGPYRPPADAPRDFVHAHPRPVDPQRISQHLREPGLYDGLEYVDRYDEEIAYTDREIGRLLAAFDRLGLREKSVIVFVADHGERLLDSKEPWPFFCHGFDPDQNVIRIPMIIRAEGLAAGRAPHPVSIVDIMPIVLSCVGLPVPDGLDGRRLTARTPAFPPYAESGDIGRGGGLHRSFIYATRKVVVRHGRSNIPRDAWAFDLVSDPFERIRLPVDDTDSAYLKLAEIIQAETDPGGTPQNYVKGERPQSPHVRALDAKTIQALKALGYVGGVDDD